MSDHGYLRQELNRRARKAGFFLALLMLGFVLTSCGKKPGHLDPPPDVTEDNFPMVYPDPATDPKP
jgi:predicted small lipoprotein YifL